jgi:hypothetical protein
MKKILYFVLFLSIAVSCKKNSEPVPAESLPDDGINPTTETEIFDSITPVTGTQLKGMFIRTYFVSEDGRPYTQEKSFR